ncbi:hypothetical protein OGA32_000111 [Salmonella enterica]|nr:hypothetical protein [Salmonella enterica]
MHKEDYKDWDVYPKLSNEEINALVSLNSKDRLLENVIEQIKNEISEKWKMSQPDHFKQREWFYHLINALNDVQYLIRQCHNKHSTHD